MLTLNCQLILRYVGPNSVYLIIPFFKVSLYDNGDWKCENYRRVFHMVNVKKDKVSRHYITP